VGVGEAFLSTITKWRTQHQPVIEVAFAEDSAPGAVAEAAAVGAAEAVGVGVASRKTRIGFL